MFHLQLLSPLFWSCNFSQYKVWFLNTYKHILKRDRQTHRVCILSQVGTQSLQGTVYCVHVQHCYTRYVQYKHYLLLRNNISLPLSQFTSFKFHSSFIFFSTSLSSPCPSCFLSFGFIYVYIQMYKSLIQYLTSSLQP